MERDAAAGTAHELTTADGAIVGARLFRPQPEPRGLVQVLHGMAEHSARYARFAAALVDAGWAVVTHDHRGHGPRAERDRTLGHFADEDGWSKVLSDVRTVREFARAEVPGGPLCLFGHSMGSFIAASEQIDRPGSADILVLSGSNRGGGPLVKAGRAAAKVERFRQGLRGKSRALAFLSFGSFNKAFQPARTEFDWLSRDPDEVDAYIDDPLCGFRCSNQLWIDLLGALGDLGEVERLARLPPSLPVYLLAGERDPVSEGGAGVRKLADDLRAAGLSQVTVKIYPGGRHEMLNETNREEVVEELLGYLSSVTA